MDLSKYQNKENIFNVETSTTINTINTEAKNTNENIENNLTKKNSKLSQLIKENNYLSKMIKNKFNKWKTITFSKRKNLERKSRKILIKKSLNIHREKDNPEIYQKEKQKIKILKKIKDINLDEEDDKKQKEIEFLKSRIVSFNNRKDIIKKYYNIWKIKSFNNEKINENINEIKIITKIKLNDKSIEQKVNVISEKFEKIKNIIIKYKNPLKMYFNLWKAKIKYKEAETYDKKILIKSVEKEQPSIKIKIIKKKVPKKQKKLKAKRKKNLTKLISKDNIKNRNNEIIKKYFYKWISFIIKDQNITKGDKPNKISSEIADINNCINIEKNKNEGNIKLMDKIDDGKEKENVNDKKYNKEKNNINKVVIKKNIIKDPIKITKQNSNINESPKYSSEDANNLIQKETENNQSISIPEISNHEFMLYKILHENLINIDKNQKYKEKEIDNKNIKLKKIIETNNQLKAYFNRWKNYLISKYDDKEKEKNEKNKLEAKEKNETEIYKTKKEKELLVFQQDSIKNKNMEKNLNIIDFIKNRMSNYLSQKEIIKKYFERWLSRIPPAIINESVVNKIITKKIFSSKKKMKIYEDEKTDINNIKKNLFGKEQDI